MNFSIQKGPGTNGLWIPRYLQKAFTEVKAWWEDADSDRDVIDVLQHRCRHFSTVRYCFHEEFSRATWLASLGFSWKGPGSPLRSTVTLTQHVGTLNWCPSWHSLMSNYDKLPQPHTWEVVTNIIQTWTTPGYYHHFCLISIYPRYQPQHILFKWTHLVKKKTWMNEF